MQVSVTEVNGVVGTPGVPLMDLLRAAVAAGQDIEATRFRGHAVSQLMRRFRKEVGARSRVLYRRLEGLGYSTTAVTCKSCGFHPCNVHAVL